MIEDTLKYNLEFTVPGLPKTFNTIAKKNIIRLKQGEKTKWLNEIYYNTLGKRPKCPLLKAKLTLWRCSSIAPDYDGLVSSFKFVIDALVACKIIIDDNMSVIGVPEFHWSYASKNNGFIAIKVESK